MSKEKAMKEDGHLSEPMVPFTEQSATIGCVGRGEKAVLHITYDDEYCFAVLSGAKLRRFVKKLVPRLWPRSAITARARKPARTKR